MEARLETRRFLGAVPWRLCRPGPLRWAVRRMLDDPGFAERAAGIAAWARENDGAQRGAELVEELACASE